MSDPLDGLAHIWQDLTEWLGTRYGWRGIAFALIFGFLAVWGIVQLVARS